MMERSRSMLQVWRLSWTPWRWILPASPNGSISQGVQRCGVQIGIKWTKMKNIFIKDEYPRMPIITCLKLKINLPDKDIGLGFVKLRHTIDNIHWCLWFAMYKAMLCKSCFILCISEMFAVGSATAQIQAQSKTCTNKYKYKSTTHYNSTICIHILSWQQFVDKFPLVKGRYLGLG